MESHTFDPIINQSSKILILGSFPSVKSREASFYYMHPSNRFWVLLEKIFDDDFSSKDIQKKIRLLHKHHIALFDVIESCNIEGSKDASITSVNVQPIASMIQQTKIKHIYLNGSKASTLFKTHFPQLMHLTTTLPSTSSANARYRLDDLYDQWKVIKKETL